MNKLRFFLLGLLFFASSGSLLAQIVASASVTSDVSCRLGTDGEITVTVTSVDVAPYAISIRRLVGSGSQTYHEEFNLTTLPQTTVFSLANGNMIGLGSTGGIPAGTYRVFIFDDSGDPALEIDLAVEQPASFVNEILVSNSPSCNGNDGEVVLNATGGTPGYEYNIDGGTFQASSTFSNLAPGTYNFSARDANLCVDPTPLANIIVLGASDAGTLDIDTDQICVGEEVQLSVTDYNNSIVRWESSTDNFATITTNLGQAGEDTITVSNILATTQFRVVVESPGCAEAISNVVEVEVFAVPTVYDITPANNGCANPGLTIGLSDSDVGITYRLLRNGNPVPGGAGTQLGTGAAISFGGNRTTTGTYTVQAFNSALNSCVANMDGTVVIRANPTARINGTTSICAGDTTLLSFTLTGTAPFDVEYSDGTSTFLLNDITNGATVEVFPTSTTTYTLVSVTDSNPIICTGTLLTPPAVITVNALPNASATAGRSSICLGDTTQLTATGGTSYSWSPATGLSNANIFNPIAEPTVTTSYIVTVSNANGCIDRDTVEVVVSPLPNVSALAARTQICAGDTTQLNATGVGTFSWSPAGSLNFSNIANPIATPTATTDYIVTITDGNNCENTDTVRVTVLPLPVIAATSGRSVICIGDTTRLSATGGGTYLWSPATGLSNVTAQNPIFTSSATGNQVYTVTVTGANGCVATDSVSVLVNPIPNASATAARATICLGDTTQLTGTGGTSYSWSPATGLSNANIFNPIAEPTVTTSYIVTVSNANGCIDRDTVEVVVSPLPNVSALAARTQICAGDTTQLNATGVGTFSWSPAGSLNFSNIANPIATPTATTDYIVTITDGNNCENTDTVRVTVLPLPVVAATSGRSIICIGDTTRLSATGGGTYLWSPATGLSNVAAQNPIFTSSATGNQVYTVTVTGANGCVATDNVSVTVNPLNANANITSAPVQVCALDTISLVRAVAGGAMQWSALPGGGTFLPGNSASPNVEYVPSNADIANGSVRIILRPLGNCGGLADTVSVAITPLPAGSITTTNQTICENGSVNVQFNLTGATLYNIAYTINGVPITQNNVGGSPTQFLGPLLSNTTLILTSVSNAVTGCSVAVSDTLLISVIDPPTISAGSDSTLCADVASFQLSGSASAYLGNGTRTISWSHNGAGAFIGATNNLSPSYNPANGGEVVAFVLTITDSPCTLVRDTVEVTFTEPYGISIDAGSSQDICPGEDDFILKTTRTSPLLEATWSTLGDGVFSVNGADTLYTFGVNDLAIDSVVLIVATSDPDGIGAGSCVAVQDSIVLHLNQGGIIASANLGAATVNSCEGEELTFRVSIANRGNGAGIEWLVNGVSVQNNGIDSLQLSTLDNGDQVVVRVTINDPAITACLATPQPMTDTVTVNILPLPTATISGQATTSICEEDAFELTFNFTGTGPFNVTFQDQDGNDSTLTNIANGATLSLEPPVGVTTYTLVSASDSNNPSCSATTLTGSVEVTVSPNATVTDLTPQTVCAGSDVEIEGIITNGTGVWSASSGVNAGTFESPTSTLTNAYTPSAFDIAQGSVTLRLTPDGTCHNGFEEMVVTIIDLTQPNAGLNQAICVNQTSLTGNSVNVGETGVWSFVPNVGQNQTNILFSDPESPTATVTGLPSGLSQFVWTIEDLANTCIKRDTVNINVANEFASFDLSSDGDQTVFCQSIELTLDGSEVGISYSLFRIFDIDNDLTADTTLVSTGVGTGSALSRDITLSGTYYVAASNGTCQAIVSNNLTLTAEPQTFAEFVTTDRTLCATNSTIIIDIALSGNGGPYDLRYTFNGVQFDELGVPDGDTVSVALPTDTPGQFVFKLVSINEANACNPTVSSDSLVIVITDEIVPSVALSSSAQCDGSDITFTAVTALNDIVQGVGSDFRWFVDGVLQNGEADSIFVASGVAEDAEVVVQWEVTDAAILACTPVAQASDTLVVDFPDLPDPVVGTFCSDDDEFVLPDPSGNGVWTSAISSGDTITSFDPSTGTDTLTYTSTVSGCILAVERIVVVTPAPQIVLNTASQSICINNVLELEATPATGVWSGTGISNGNEFSSAVTGTFVLTYTLTVDGCTSDEELTVTVTDQPIPPTLLVSDDQTYCIGQTIPMQKAVGDTIRWFHVDDANAFLGEDSVDVNAIANAVGVYTFRVSNSTSCGVAEELITIEMVNETPAPTVATVATICANNSFPNSVSLNNGITGATFAWYTDNLKTTQLATTAAINPNSVPQISGLAPGASTSLFVSQILANCGESDLTEVTFSKYALDAEECEFECSTFTVTVGSNNVSCPGENDGSGFILILAGGTGFYEYKFASEQDDAYRQFEGFGEEIPDLAQGSYLIQIRNQGHPDCVVQRVINVGTAASLSSTVNLGNPTCSGGDGRIIIGAGAGSYLFTLRAENNDTIAQNTTGDFTGLDAGIYNYTFIDQNSGCFTSAATVVLPLANVFEVSADKSDPTCDGNDGQLSLSASGGSGSYTYHLINVALNYDQDNTSGSFVDLAEGTYTFVVQDNINVACLADSATVTLSGGAGFVATASEFVNPACFGEATGAAELNISTNLGQYSIDNGVTWINFTSGNPVNNLPPNGTYNVLIRAVEDGCVRAVEVIIENPDEILLTGAISTTSNASCDPGETDGAIEVPAISGGVPPYRFFINDDSNEITGLSGAGGIISNLSRTADLLIVEDSQGCRKEFEFEIDVPGAIITSFAPSLANVECDTSSIKLAVVKVLPSTAVFGPFFVEIVEKDNPNVVISETIQNVGDSVVVALKRGVRYVSNVTRTGESCNQALELEISGGSRLINYSLEANPVSCIGLQGEVVLSNISGLLGQSYFYTIFDRDGNPLAGYENIEINHIASLSPYHIEINPGNFYKMQLYQDQGSCGIIPSKLTEFNIVEPTGQLGAAVTNTVVSIPGAATGSVTLEITNRSGAEPYFAKIYLEQALINDDLPLLELSGEFEVFDQNLNTTNYFITFDSLIAGTYTIEVTDAFGCDQLILVPFTVEIDIDRSVFIPNLITPNDDNLNDRFMIRNMPETGTKIVISNRWGNVVYRNNNYTRGQEWDGGTEPDGVYFYEVIIEDQKYTGWLEVWRANIR